MYNIGNKTNIQHIRSNKCNRFCHDNHEDVPGVTSCVIIYAIFARIYNKTPNISEIKIVLKDLLNYSENKVTVDLIQSLVCKFFKISKTEMLSSRRSRYLVRPRQTAIYLTKLLTTKSLPEIGRDFSNRDHTTVIHSIKTIENLKKNDNELCNNIDILKNQILYNNQRNEI